MKHTLLIIAGTLSLILGVIGIVLPVLPTTPFLLLSASCYFYGSKRLYDKLMQHKVLGGYIRSFREEKAIPLSAKVVSVSLLWLSLLYCTFFVAESLLLQILFILTAIGVSFHILSYKTRKK